MSTRRSMALRRLATTGRRNRRPVLVETFIDPDEGTCYRAANWRRSHSKILWGSGEM